MQYSYSLACMLSYFQLFACSLLMAVTIVGQDKEREKRSPQALYEAAQSFEDKEDWVAAEREWQRVLQTTPNDARVWLNLGVVLNRLNKTDEAAAAWRRAAELDPALSGAFFNLGVLLVRKHEFAQATIPLRRALELEPDNDSARRAFALALIGTDSFSEASREIA